MNKTLAALTIASLAIAPMAQAGSLAPAVEETPVIVTEAEGSSLSAGLAPALIGGAIALAAIAAIADDDDDTAPTSTPDS